MSVISLDAWRRKQERLSTSQSQSTQTSQSEQAGQTHTDNDDTVEVVGYIGVVLQTARMKPFTTKSDFARRAAVWVALCASDGLITTRVNETQISNVWMITQEGLEVLEGLGDVLSD